MNLVRLQSAAMVWAIIASSPLALAAIKKAEGPIPELKPPMGPLPFEVPESAIFAGALGLAFAVLIAGRVLQSRRPPPPLPVPQPFAKARASLAQVSDPDALQECGRILRRYLEEGYGIGPEGATAGELSAQFTAHAASDPESASALDSFLNEVELARFTPAGAPMPAGSCVNRTLELLTVLERRRKAAQYPALPVVT